MNYLHWEFSAGPNSVIEVTLDHQANVKLLDPINYQKYQKGQQYKYSGGLATTSPTHISPPRQDHWHLVVDLGGYAGRIRASARKLQEADLAAQRK